LGLVALWLYVDITGAAPSAVRAFAMVALVQTSLVLRTPRNPIAALTASALLVILVAPLQVFSASFQLSYGIVAALLLLGLPLSDRLQEKLTLFRDLPPVSWSWMHHLLDATWRATLAALSLGIAASLVSAIAGVMFFELFTPGALIANLWLIPASSAVILTGFLSLLCGLAGFSLGAEIANHAAVLLLWGIENGVRFFASLPGAWVEATFRASWLGPAAFAFLLATMAAGYACRWRGWARGFWPPVAVVALTLLLAVRFP
jgi:ComEC/Rec2-related protein